VEIGFECKNRSGVKAFRESSAGCKGDKEKEGHVIEREPP